MNRELAPSAVALVARIVFDTFDVTEEEAHENAKGLVALAEGWAGVGAAPLDWAGVVKKHFGARLKWRSEAVHRRFIDDKNQTFTAYEGYIRARK